MPTVLVIGCIPIFTFYLGTWQLRRLKWKLNLIEQLNEQLNREPLKLPSAVNLDILAEFEFRKFIAEGIWDHSRSILLGPKTKDGVQGYQVITPLVRQDGSTILVDRGFISKDCTINRRLKDVYCPEGRTTVLGMLRTKLQDKNPFTPENTPETGEWFWLDLKQLADYFGRGDKKLQPVYLETIFDGNTGQIAEMIDKGIPVGRPSHIELRNMHATYAITWFSLSFTTALMLVGLLRKKRMQIRRLL
ncbi:hypothetical protein Clacol_006807 [Clathrus columnatus]|uniref:SURF1-like protein n=1 Tax=Clathrus columnatus TaxID=1419009 RepID=A0AAV5AIQ2_9AGAM|nr:hypothetical protein Clacol_006807 [Clathrus columnatus]